MAGFPTRWAYVEDGKVVDIRDILPDSYKNVSNLKAMSAEELRAISWYVMEVDETDILGADGMKYVILPPEYTFFEDRVLQKWSKKERPIEEQEAMAAAAEKQRLEYEELIKQRGLRDIPIPQNSESEPQ